MASSWLHHGLRHGAWRPSSAAGGQPSQGLVCRCDHSPIAAEVALLLALPLRHCLHAPAMRMNEVVAVVHDNARATRHPEGRPTSAAALTPLAHPLAHSLANPIAVHRSIGLSIGLSAYRSAGASTGISTTGISPGAPPLLPADVSAEDARILRRAGRCTHATHDHRNRSGANARPGEALPSMRLPASSRVLPPLRQPATLHAP